jgi:predicted component of type VI protein secretion system
MNRLTITLTEERHAALKQAAAQRRKSMGELIEESLEHFGIRTDGQALALLQRARQNAALSADAAMALALKEVKAHRAARAK